MVCAVLVFGFMFALVAPAAAHPGRLDKDGCHHVHTLFVHKSGKVDKVGDYHCHRKLGEMKLDGSEQLHDDTPKDHDPKEDRDGLRRR